MTGFDGYGPVHHFFAALLMAMVVGFGLGSGSGGKDRVLWSWCFQR